jgi:hypothetical protein
MRPRKIFALTLMPLAVLAAADRAGAAILGLNASVTFSGSDDGGPYTVDVFTGPISPGAEVSEHFFRQNTNMGFHTQSNQLDGIATMDVVGETITVGFSGQAQPGALSFDFTGASFSPQAQITDVGTSTAGIMAGVNQALVSTFTGDSVTGMGFFLFGYQPGTNVSQTATLTLGAIPEPSTLALALAGFSALATWRRRAGR